MSFVTNIVLSMSILEDDMQIKDANAFFTDCRPLIGLHDTELLPSGWYGGSKYLECCLYVGAFNYLDLDGFLKHMQTIKWVYPEEVQVWVKEDNDESFRLIMGVEEQDKRIVERDNLLVEAEDLISDFLPLIPADNYDLAYAKNWLEKYKQLKEARGEP